MMNAPRGALAVGLAFLPFILNEGLAQSPPPVNIIAGPGATFTPGPNYHGGTATLTATGTATTTTIVAGACLTGGTISTSGTIAEASIAAGTLAGNAGTVAACPTAIAIGADITLSPTGTLSATAPNPGTVTRIIAGTGLAGGTITNAGTVSLAARGASSLMGNPAVGTAVPSDVTIGNNLTLTAGGTLNASAPGTGTVQNVVVQGGPFLSNATITNAGTIANSVTSLPAHGVMIGEGTAAVTATAAMGAGALLFGQGGTDPLPAAVSGDMTANAAGQFTLGSVVVAGTVGSAAGIPVVVYDQKGRIISTSTAVPAVTAAGLGAVINSGSVQINSAITLAGTAAGTLAIAPGSGTSDVLINMPAAGGTVTLGCTPAFAHQRWIEDIAQGATAGVLNLGSLYVFGSSPTSFTITPTASVHDRLAIESFDGTHCAVLAVNQNFAF